MFDEAGLLIPDAHSKFTDMKCAIYPSWLEKILKFTDVTCVNTFILDEENTNII